MQKLLSMIKLIENSSTNQNIKRNGLPNPIDDIISSFEEPEEPEETGPKTNRMVYKDWTIEWDIKDRKSNTYRAMAINPESSMGILKVYDGVNPDDALEKIRSMVDSWDIRNSYAISGKRCKLTFNVVASEEIFSRIPKAYCTAFKWGRDEIPHLFLSPVAHDGWRPVIELVGSPTSIRTGKVYHGSELTTSNAKIWGIKPGKYTFGDPKVFREEKIIGYPLIFHCRLDDPHRFQRMNVPTVTISFTDMKR